MSTLLKKLRALQGGKELSWSQIVSLVEAFGAEVFPPRGGGSHHKIVFPGKCPIIVPVHNGRVKKVYATKLADAIESMME